MTLRLAPDSVLLPVSSGGLLVSRAHATFCAVAPDEADPVLQVVAGARPFESLGAELRARLETHGFLGAPRSAPGPSPLVQIQVTNACNLACSYCCTNSGPPRATELSLEALRSVVDQARAELGPSLRVGLLGGEPFLVPWTIDLAEHVVGLGLDLTIFTNGMALRDEALARRVAAIAKRGAHVRVSLAAASRERCDSVSGATRFDDVLAAIHTLTRAGAIPIVDLMLFPQDVADAARSLPALRALLPSGCVIAIGLAFLGGRERGEHVFGTRGELEEALDRIAFDAGETIPAARPSPVADRREGCSCVLGQHLHVRSDGALFTCFKMEEQVGDLGADRFVDALSRVRARPRPVTTLPACQACALATLCGGGCRVENLQMSGVADDPACGPWRVQVLSELLAEDRPSAIEWPVHHLLAEAQRRGIEAPARIVPVIPSRHLIDR